jgi:hypothetical protein
MLPGPRVLIASARPARQHDRPSRNFITDSRLLTEEAWMDLIV